MRSWQWLLTAVAASVVAEPVLLRGNPVVQEPSDGLQWFSNASLVSVHEQDGLGVLYNFHVPVPPSSSSGGLANGSRALGSVRSVAVITLLRHGAEEPQGKKCLRDVQLLPTGEDQVRG